MLAFLRKNDRPGTSGLKSVAAWRRQRLAAPVGHVQRCRVVAARAVGVDEKAGRNGAP
jgi:hypothetical protein